MSKGVPNKRSTDQNKQRAIEYVDARAVCAACDEFLRERGLAGETWHQIKAKQMARRKRLCECGLDLDDEIGEDSDS